MYQSLKSETVHSQGMGTTLRPVDGSYQGVDRRRTLEGRLAEITPFMVLSWIHRYWLVVTALAVVGALIGIGATLVIKPRYTSYSQILLNPNDLQLLEDDLYARAAGGEAQVIEVESRMRILTSTSVLGRVVDVLDLANDPDFIDSAGLASRDAAIRALSQRVAVQRDERSFVVTASVWGPTPERSAVLTDAVVEAFLAELNGADAQGALAAAQGLQQRLAELRDEAAAAEAAVVNYRRQNKLPMTSEAQLSTRSAVELNVQVDTARQALLNAEARYAALISGEIDSGLDQSSTLAQLRAAQAVARQRADSLGATMGPRHPSLQAAQAELAALKSEIEQEETRVVEVARSELQSARDLFDQLSNAAGVQMEEVFTDETALLELRQLERTAASAVALYEAYLTRAQQTAERSQISTSTVRVISPAMPPVSRSYPPRTALMMIGGFMFGLALGIAAAIGAGLWRLLAGQRIPRALPMQANAA